MAERKLKEYWCQEKHDFCRPDGTNDAYQEMLSEWGYEPVVLKCFGVEIPTELLISKDMLHDLVHHNDDGAGAFAILEETVKALTDGLKKLVIEMTAN